MASVSMSHMILFIASMMIAASVAGVFTSTVDRVADAIDDQGVQVSDNVRTDIEVISDAGDGACVYNCDGQDNVTLHVKNTGSKRLPARSGKIDVLVNGQYQPTGDIHVEVLGESDLWRPGEVIRMNVTETGLSTGEDHRVKVIINSDEEVFRFHL